MRFLLTRARVCCSFATVLEMYSFRVYPGRIVVRLDKPADRCVLCAHAHVSCSRALTCSCFLCSFGSPQVDELTAFSTAFDTALDVAGVSPDELTVEVSSAGAERCAFCLLLAVTLRIPCANAPMRAAMCDA
jgi:hypothetical protein